ncbi:B12-binding domain-containing radical SAM protein [Gottfriedia solisilvae]|uniref:B12-binding domain-containing radical SAM protein n=1 Tax=Gottfriedia solisilvae TaxID=1516104 RepID=A0A8J3AQU4_9BACI|nr:B12-binding domain-containing radical SAM protein [Gottfriedia solisilvae]GGI14673.1 B12-binding domain-containing radical SAM protein [Gottfriedia solisilvae]
MKVVLATLNAKYIHTNLGIRYIKAYAQPEYEIELAEYTIKDPSMNIITDLYKKKPKIVGFSSYIWNIEQTIEVIQMYKKIDPNVTIFIGGPEVSYDVQYWLDRVKEVDVVVVGEGEITVKNLIKAIDNGEDFSKISGIGYRDNGLNIVRPQTEKLDLTTIPSPYRFKEDLPFLSKRIQYIETSRGCPFNCQFCLSSIEVGVRYFNREVIKDDIRYLMANGAKVFKFVDRTFNISRSYAMDMFQFLIDEHVEGTVFQFEITGDIMRPEVIEFLNENAPKGLFRFEIGVQSTNDATNELVMRRQNFEKLCRTVTLVRDGEKIDQHLDLIAGLPEEDYQSFRQTFNDVFALRPEELQLGFLKMLRGTGVRLRAHEHDYVYMDYAPYEVLGNNILSFEDIVKIKQVEDVLEKYWNDHRTNNTIEYLIENEFESPFDFFQLFGSYWEERGWSRIGHQLEDLFKRLDEFLNHYSIKNGKITKDIMKVDYYLNHKYKPRKPWWDESTDNDFSKRIYKQILEQPEFLSKEFLALNLNEKELYKHTMVELLSFDIEHFLQTNEYRTGSYAMLIFFSPKTLKPSFFTLEV